MVCQVCLNPDRSAVDAAIVENRAGDRTIAACFKIGVRAVKKHRSHLPQLLEKQPSTLPLVMAPTYHFHIYPVEQEALEEPETVAAEGVGG